MKTKQQAIQESYGENYKANKIGELGWFRVECPSADKPEKNGFSLDEVDVLSGLMWRPKSLQGIENNNGWIKIESEEDLPKEIEGLWEVIMNGKQVFIELLKDNRERLYKDLKKDGITHYKIVPKSKPPIH